TQIEGGHAENALPQTATAVINCRVVPQTPVEEILQIMTDLAAPYGIEVTQVAKAYPSPPSPLTPAIVEPVRAVAAEMWPGIEVVPEMSTGATDGLFVRNVGIPVYGVSAIAEDPNENRIHGKDERIRVASFNEALQYWYRLLRRYSGG
ncbi:MAG TPA: M20/M25/M40 family metallo-hydrolase, partial [Woeseiaceae bacterium]|nr:M20/M25/M40 family metallo-hydrolase [Woeseiaceae bacterium]